MCSGQRLPESASLQLVAEDIWERPCAILVPTGLSRVLRELPGQWLSEQLSDHLRVCHQTAWRCPHLVSTQQAAMAGQETSQSGSSTRGHPCQQLHSHPDWDAVRNAAVLHKQIDLQAKLPAHGGIPRSFFIGATIARLYCRASQCESMHWLEEPEDSPIDKQQMQPCLPRTALPPRLIHNPPCCYASQTNSHTSKLPAHGGF